MKNQQEKLPGGSGKNGWDAFFLQNLSERPGQKACAPALLTFFPSVPGIGLRGRERSGRLNLKGKERRLTGGVQPRTRPTSTSFSVSRNARWCHRTRRGHN